MVKDARGHHAELRGAYIRAQHELVGNSNWSVKDEDNLDMLEDMVKAMVVGKVQPKSLLRPATTAPSASELGTKAVGDALATLAVPPDQPNRPRGFA